MGVGVVVLVAVLVAAAAALAVPAVVVAVVAPAAVAAAPAARDQSDDEKKMSKKQITVIILAVSLILLSGVWFYYSRVLSVNYLIPGVPYNGIQNLFFQGANMPAIASTMDILGYWGDERFKIADLKEKFSLISTSSPPYNIKNFFEENDYEVYQKNSSNLNGEINEIKKFVNPQKKIPVIVFQKRFLDSEISILVPRVVIGIFDNKKKVVVHDNLLGNNYEISYEDFGRMFKPNTWAILAVWPSDKIKGVIKGPNYNLLYPKRTEAMDKLSHLFTSKASEAVFYQLSGNFEKNIALYKKFVEDPNFEYSPPAFRVSILSAFARIYIKLKQYDEAIKIINERVLPLNQNLSKTPEGWFISVDKFSYPYFVLSLAYLKKGDKNLASAYYKEMALLRDASVKIIGDKTFTLPRIEELEKEISSTK